MDTRQSLVVRRRPFGRAHPVIGDHSQIPVGVTAQEGLVFYEAHCHLPEAQGSALAFNVWASVEQHGGRGAGRKSEAVHTRGRRHGERRVTHVT